MFFMALRSFTRPSRQAPVLRMEPLLLQPRLRLVCCGELFVGLGDQLADGQDGERLGSAGEGLLKNSEVIRLLLDPLIGDRVKGAVPGPASPMRKGREMGGQEMGKAPVLDIDRPHLLVRKDDPQVIFVVSRPQLYAQALRLEHPRGIDLVHPWRDNIAANGMAYTIELRWRLRPFPGSNSNKVPRQQATTLIAAAKLPSHALQRPSTKSAEEDFPPVSQHAGNPLVQIGQQPTHWTKTRVKRHLSKLLVRDHRAGNQIVAQRNVRIGDAIPLRFTHDLEHLLLTGLLLSVPFHDPKFTAQLSRFIVVE